jgi:transcriptional regulator with AAA-type ATPase domain
MTVLFPPTVRPIARAMGQLGFTNPFTEERIRLERQVLGDSAPSHDLWIMEPGQQGSSPHLAALSEAGERAIAAARDRLQTGVTVDDSDWQCYADLAMYVLYYRVENLFYPVLIHPEQSATRMPFYSRFLQDWQSLLGQTPLMNEPQYAPAHLFALFFQIRRAFHLTYRAISGTTRLSAGLRADVWNSIFTHDLRRYRKGLHARMQEFSTLVLGPSGTGKELVAQAIGMSQYIPFQENSRQFLMDFRQCHQPVHLAALPATLLESELFGHCKGAFTGAIADRAGFLETRHAAQTVFLDEVGELPPEVQVKLLRVLQSRHFQRVGDHTLREFHGRIIAATHRDLGVEMENGRFREDLYYRLCSDIIRTPSLRDQLREKPAELDHLLSVVSLRLVDRSVASELAGEAAAWIRKNLPDHPWPGNMRELEQCVRSILIRGRYAPPSARQAKASDAATALGMAVAAGDLDHEQLLGRYFALVYARCGSYEAAGQRLGIDWRTIKTRMDQEFLRRIQGRD